MEENKWPLQVAQNDARKYKKALREVRRMIKDYYRHSNEPIPNYIWDVLGFIVEVVSD